MFVVLVVLFYIEEDLRGAYAWSKAKQELAAQGISLDPQTYIPPPVPDAENFGALPIFKLDPPFDSTDPNKSKSDALNDALKNINSSISSSKETSLEPKHLPYLGNWQKAEKPDSSAIQKQLEDFCANQSPPVQVPSTVRPTDIFRVLCPTLSDLRAESAIRPLCRFDLDYAARPPRTMSLSPITEQIMLAKVLSYEERLAFLSGLPDLALDDLKVTWKINSGLRNEPLLISGLVSLGVVAMQLTVVNQGLAEHVWNDQQLAALDDDLGKIDCLTESQLAIRGDTVVFMLPAGEYIKNHRRAMMNGLLMKGTILEHQATWDDYLMQGMFVMLPNGWVDRFNADCARFNLLETVNMVDPASRRVFPDREQHALDTIEKSGATSWWNGYVSSIVRPSFNAIRKFAYSQVQIDETRIACRLERYRLVHGNYPETLDALVPTYGAELPRDIMNGEPYHYKLHGDGTFMLYSVGWNQKDDGGQLGTKFAYHNSDNLDWIWTNYPDLPIGK